MPGTHCSLDSQRASYHVNTNCSCVVWIAECELRTSSNSLLHIIRFYRRLSYRSTGANLETAYRTVQ
jgi:hypothetical protein